MVLLTFGLTHQNCVLFSIPRCTEAVLPRSCERRYTLYKGDFRVYHRVDCELLGDGKRTLAAEAVPDVSADCGWALAVLAMNAYRGESGNCIESLHLY